MRKQVGVWIDHARATIIWVDDGQIDVEHIESGVKPGRRLAGESRFNAALGPQDLASDGRIGEGRREHVRIFLDRVLDAVAGATEIVLLGRGMLKSRVGERIGKSQAMAARLDDVIEANPMTERQVVIRVREYYGTTPRRRR